MLWHPSGICWGLNVAFGKTVPASTASFVHCLVVLCTIKFPGKLKRTESTLLSPGRLCSVCADYQGQTCTHSAKALWLFKKTDLIQLVPTLVGTFWNPLKPDSKQFSFMQLKLKPHWFPGLLPIIWHLKQGNVVISLNLSDKINFKKRTKEKWARRHLEMKKGWVHPGSVYINSECRLGVCNQIML